MDDLQAAFIAAAAQPTYSEEELRDTTRYYYDILTGLRRKQIRKQDKKNSAASLHVGPYGVGSQDR